MSGALLGLMAVSLVIGAGVFVAAAFRVEDAAAFFLTVYVVGFAEVVALSLLLSRSGVLTRGGLLFGVSGLFVIAAAAWVLAGSPRPPKVRFPLLAEVVRSRNGLFLAIAVAIAFAYVLALIVGTPPNGWDPLNYHLARVAFWLQARRIGYIEPTYDERLNLNPPNAEIGSAFALGVTHDEQLVGLVQFFAVIVCAVAVFALARRVGLTAVEAVFGTLLFLSLPIVALQASLTKNDLVVASFLLSATVFVLRRRRRDFVLAAVATALAVGTKTTALYGLVILLAVAAAARPPALRAERMAAIALGALAGCYWYLVNLVETGKFFGDQSAQQGVTAVLQARADAVTAYGMAVDTLDLSGSRGKDILIYVIAAAVTCALVLRRARGRDAVVVAALGSLPLLLLWATEHVGRPGLVHLYEKLGNPTGYIGEGSAAASPTIASDTASWFGPLGFLLIFGAVVAVFWKRRSTSQLDRIFALAPLAWFVLVALSLSYNPFLGRFFVFPVALSAALWGRTLKWPGVAPAVALLAAVTLGLTLVHYSEKPSGLRLIDGSRTVSVWGMPRWQVQSQHDPNMAPAFRFLDENVPTAASVALALGDNGFGYPVFGPHLDRRVEIVPAGSNGHDTHTDWIFASPQRAAEIDRSCWSKRLDSPGGSIFKRRCG